VRNGDTRSSTAQKEAVLFMPVRLILGPMNTVNSPALHSFFSRRAGRTRARVFGGAGQRRGILFESHYNVIDVIARGTENCRIDGVNFGLKGVFHHIAMCAARARITF
jgi:hypothetical protein